MSTLPVVEEILRETEVPMSVRQIVEYAGSRLPTRSKTPDTVVARDLSMDIKKKGEASTFIRTAPGRYTIREIHLRQQEAAAQTRQQEPAAQTRQQEPATEAARVQSDADACAERAAHVANGGRVADAGPTPVLSSAMREERAAPLAARKPAESSEGRKTAG